MAMIKVENLTFSYPGSYDNIFENASFQIDSDWKLGFVGRNGRGKTTFLSLLMGKYEYSGRIISPLQFDYFPYPVSDKTRITGEVLADICPQAEEWEFMRELGYLDVEAEVLWRPFDTLSNGEQTKALLAALFLNEGHFLLIDEPTNHLDLMARETVAAYLKKKKGFILVSHDRSFLDGCVDHILTINRSSIEVQKGDFSAWWEGKQQRDSAELAANERLKKEINRLSEAAERSAGWSAAVERSKQGGYDKGYIGHKSAKMMKRAKSIESRQQQAIEEKSALLKDIEASGTLKLHPLRHHAELLVEMTDVYARYGEKTVCGPVSLKLRQGERIALDGRNGSGKSSLLKLITGGGPEHSGSLALASGLIISYVAQDTSDLRGDLKDYAADWGIDESLFKAILRKLGFERIQFEKDMADFSGGQKKKVLIARSLCEQAHLYIWDEPLNFIDLHSRMQIEQLIQEFSPSMIFVEHDKVFRELIADRVVSL